MLKTINDMKNKHVKLGLTEIRKIVIKAKI